MTTTGGDHPMNESAPFQGFPKTLPAFLWGLSLNNERAWFQRHKDTFEQCLNGPIRALAEEIRLRLNDASPHLAPALHVSRIWRDARRLRGGGPFNDHMWFSLGLSGEIYTPTPQFWFGINAKGWDAGMGIWHMSGELLERWRKSIDDRPRELAAIVRDLEKHPELVRYGQTYKRPKGDPGPELFDWYNARTVGLEHVEWFEPDPPGRELADRLMELYTALTPLYQYLAGLSSR